jgi:hypothetical protein
VQRIIVAANEVNKDQKNKLGLRLALPAICGTLPNRPWADANDPGSCILIRFPFPLHSMGTSVRAIRAWAEYDIDHIEGPMP